MRISNKWAQAQINVKEWWPAKGVTPQILKSLENGNYMGRYIEQNNHCSL